MTASVYVLWEYFCKTIPMTSEQWRETCEYCTMWLISKLMDTFVLIFFTIKLVNRCKHIQFVTPTEYSLVLWYIRYQVKTLFINNIYKVNCYQWAQVAWTSMRAFYLCTIHPLIPIIGLISIWTLDNGHWLEQVCRPKLHQHQWIYTQKQTYNTWRHMVYIF